MNRCDALELIEAVQSMRFEGSEIEVKTAHRGLPSRLYETLSAFANRPGGGVVILGLDESRGFAAVGVGDPQQRLAVLGDQASRMEPPLRLHPVVVHVEGNPVIVFEVPECDSGSPSANLEIALSDFATPYLGLICQNNPDVGLGKLRCRIV